MAWGTGPFASSEGIVRAQRWWYRQEGSYGAPFRIDRGVTQGDPLLPTILNVVVDVMVCHWESLLSEQEGQDSSSDKRDVAQTAGRTIWDRDDGRQRAEEGHQLMTLKAAFFYANNGMVDSIDLGWLKLEFDTLTGIFD